MDTLLYAAAFFVFMISMLNLHLFMKCTKLEVKLAIALSNWKLAEDDLNRATKLSSCEKKVWLDNYEARLTKYENYL